MNAMGIEERLVAALEAAPDVAALVGDRIYPHVHEQGAGFPSLTYFRVSTATEATLDGQGPDRPRMQIDCWAWGYLEARRLAKAVRLAMNGLGALCEGDRDDLDETSGLRRVILEFTIREEA